VGRGASRRSDPIARGEILWCSTGHAARSFLEPPRFRFSARGISLLKVFLDPNSETCLGSGPQVGGAEKGLHFVRAGDFKFWNRVGQLKPLPHRSSGVKQFEANVVIVRPALQEHQHTQAATLDRGNTGKIQQDDTCVILRHHCVAQ
jgi:hypothetical protein